MVDWNLPIQTRDGRKARLLGVLSGVGGDNYVVAIADDEGTEDVYHYYINGRYIQEDESNDDIINVPETVERWVNVYEKDTGLTYETQEDAGIFKHKNPSNKHIGLVKLTIIDGKLERSDVVKDEQS